METWDLGPKAGAPVELFLLTGVWNFVIIR